MKDGKHDRAVSFHEAGHAVVALALGRPVQLVTVLPDKQRLGRCEFGKGKFKPTDDWLEREVLIALAGVAAEARVTGRYDWGGAQQDLRGVEKLASLRAGDRHWERLSRRMLSKVENLLEHPGNWRAVELIAEELIRVGEISGRAARHFFDKGLAEFADA